jgi:hypothetical protein
MLRRANYAQAADTLEGAVVTYQSDVALSVPDRAAMLSVLEEPHTDALAQLRAVLLQEEFGRDRGQLA